MRVEICPHVVPTRFPSRATVIKGLLFESPYFSFLPSTSTCSISEYIVDWTLTNKWNSLQAILNMSVLNTELSAVLHLLFVTDKVLIEAYILNIIIIGCEDLKSSLFLSGTNL